MPGEPMQFATTDVAIAPIFPLRDEAQISGKVATRDLTPAHLSGGRGVA
jgi:hypothetical protein